MEEYLPVKMIIYVFIIGILSQSIQGQKFVVTHAPSYVAFQEQEHPLPASDVPKVISHTLGVPSQSDMQWQGLLQGSVFKRPKANVLVTVFMTENIPSLPLKSKAEFPVDLDTPGVDVDSLMTSLQGSFMDRNPLLLDAAVDNNMFDIRSEFDVFRKLPNTLRRMSDRLLDMDSVAQEHSTGTLNTSQPTDLTLMGELQMMKDVLKTVGKSDSFLKTKTPDLFSFTITGLQGVANKHGPASSQTTDASNLITDVLHEVTEQFKTIYKDNVVVEILMINPPTGHIRKVRSLKETESTKSNNTRILHRVADSYDENYPVIFNIVLWLMILLAIVLFGIGYGIWNMDPGRDSIIYRMTTTRLKKD